MSYPNMSYCMCENTLLALRQVVQSMQEDGPAFLKEMSREERRAFQELFNTCEDFLNVSEELVEQEERAVSEANEDHDDVEFDTADWDV